MSVVQDGIGRIYSDSSNNRESALAMLWGALQAHGTDFQRNQQFGRYHIDFYSQDARLAVQVDRGAARYDDVARARDLRLEALGIRMLHIPPVEVLRDINNAIETILAKN
jgi:very-short-patch-repair endonuclease